MRRQKQIQTQEALLVRLLGGADYEKAVEIRRWLDSKKTNDTFPTLLRFLIDGVENAADVLR